MRATSYIKGVIVTGIISILCLAFFDMIFPASPPLWIQGILGIFITLPTGYVAGDIFEDYHDALDEINSRTRTIRLQWE